MLTTKAQRGTEKIPTAVVEEPLDFEIEHCFTLKFNTSAELDPELEAKLLPSNADRRDFLGGHGSIMCIRYRSTPIGPYDEIVLVPGAFAHPPNADIPAPTFLSDRRFTRIFVSHEDALRIGREMLGTRKEMAKFKWTFSENQIRLIVQEDHPDSKRLLIDVTFSRPWSLFSVPVPLDFLTLVAPSICERRIDEDGVPVGDEEWVRTRFGGFLWASVAGINGTPNRVQSPVFPDLQDLEISSVLYTTGTMRIAAE